MKIATMVRGYIPAPRPVDIVYVIIDLAITIAQELAARGHQVDFYGPQGTRLKLPVRAQGLGLRSLVDSRKELYKILDSGDLLTYYMLSLWDHRLSTEMFERAAAGEYDLLHFHHPESTLSLLKFFPQVPVVYTLHDPLQKWHAETFKMFDTSNSSCVSISNNQRKAAPHLPYCATIYDGVDLKAFSYSPNHDDYLLLAGRLVADKGVREAVEVARLSGEKLLIIGPTYREQMGYFNKYVKPYLNDQIVYLGHVPHSEIMKYFQRAKALLVPIQWEEPFGMTMVEAMACGTPVIAFRRGAAPEIVRHGTTGFVVDTIAQMVEAIKKIPEIKRRDCYLHVKKNFSIDKMIDGYEQTFEQTLQNFRANKPDVKLV
jgi:glycosyltransferase involved in cell wall biosynthesis